MADMRVYQYEDLVDEQRRLWELLPEVKQCLKEYIGEMEWNKTREQLAKYAVNMTGYAVNCNLLHDGHEWSFVIWAKYGQYSTHDNVKMIASGIGELKHQYTLNSAFRWKLFYPYDIRLLFDIPVTTKIIDLDHIDSSKFPARYGRHITTDKYRMMALNRIMPIEALAEIIVVMARDPRLFWSKEGGVEKMPMRVPMEGWEL